MGKRRVWDKKRTLKAQKEREKINVPSLRREVWKDIPGYEGHYQISSRIRLKSLAKWVVGKSTEIRNLRKEQLINYYKPVGHYHQANLSKNGVKKTEGVHRLMALSFISNPENKPEVNHINGKKDDNRIKNLEWSTESENGKHKYRTGIQRAKRNEENVSCKLKNKQIRDIRKKYIPFVRTQKMLAEEYGVSATHICLILQRKKRKYA